MCSSEPTGLPKWASIIPDELSGIISLSPSHPRRVVRISNPDISWEPFHARITEPASGVRVAPAAGILAPRGGANNACDPSKPYPDACDLEVVLAAASGREPDTGPPAGPGPDGAPAGPRPDGAECRLVVCMEQRRWAWAVRVGGS